MDWEDTVATDYVTRVAMSDIKHRWLHSKGEKDTFAHDCIGEIISTQRQIQARISFNAGENKGYAHARQHCEDVIIPQAEADARREVVEWIKEHPKKNSVDGFGTTAGYNFYFGKYDWQAKLKEWNIRGE